VGRNRFKPRCKAQIQVVFDGRGAPNSRPFLIEVDPRSASVGLNGYYEADTFDIEFETRLLPFDPDQIAFAAVNIFMWDDARPTPEWAIDDNEMVGGLVDDIETEMVGDDNVVKFTGRDNTAILADSEWDPRDKVRAGGELNDVIQSIADEAAPEGTRARFEVIWMGEEDPPQVGGLHRSTKKKGLWVKAGKSYWDVIWDLCLQHAYVPRIVGRKIFIGEPRTETRRSLEMAPRLVYGRNLTGLSLKRKFARELVPQVVLTAWDPHTEERIEVVYPRERNITVGATGSTDALGIPLTVKKDEQLFFAAPKGITDRDALIRYARMRFYDLGRGQTVYKLKTSNLWIDSPLPVAGAEECVLQFRPGDAIGISFDPFNQEHLRALDIGQRRRHIIAMGYKPAVADFVADNIDRMRMFGQDYYYNRGQVSYSETEGIEIEIEAMNFASEVREVIFAERTGANLEPSRKYR
jgi:hypothetical protein